MWMSRYLFVAMQHCEDAAMHFCDHLNIKITATTLQKELVQHPDYPSLAAVGDVFNRYKLLNEAIKIPVEYLDQVPVPFIAHIKGDKASHDLFAPVYLFNKDNVGLYNSERKVIEQIPAAQFASVYKGAVLVVEPAPGAGEKDYANKLRAENRNHLYKALTVLAMPVVVILSCLYAWLSFPEASMIAPVLFTVFTLAGSVVSGLLLWNEFDRDNPLIRQLCSFGKNTDCLSVLDSSASKIGGVSWSVIGFVYFITMQLSLLAGGMVNAATLQVLSWMNVLALPYTVFSVYYQWRIAKQWCVLCLCIQAILLLQFATAWWGGFPIGISRTTLLYAALLTVGTSFIIVAAIVFGFGSVFKKARENKDQLIALQRLKHDPRVFNALLSRQKSIRQSPDGLGIIIGNPDAKNKLIKVCSPYCEPCSKVHPKVEELVYNNDNLQLQILFTASGEETDRKTLPVEHLLALASKQDHQLIEQALNDWYSAPVKDYNTFSAKYPLNGEVEKQNEKVRAMRRWCEDMNISFTPTFFINGQQLPEIYSVEDLKYFLTF